MNKWLILGFIILILLAWFLFPLLWLLVALIIILLVYRPIMRLFIPKGHRIKHGLLKSFLEQKYGKEGKSVYKEFVNELRRKGYR